MTTEGNVSIVGLDKADVLAALYNASKPLGMGFMHYTATPMTHDEAQAELDRRGERTYFDYLNGRVMKLDLTSDEEISVWGYDRDNGQGAAAVVIAELRKSGDSNSEPIELRHLDGTLDSARLVNEHLHDKSYTQKDGNRVTFGLTLGDAAEFLKPHIDEVLKNDE